MNKTIERIILNVGGVKYETNRSTLLTQPGSFLSTMLSNEKMVKFENENEIFLDRNGRAFHYILEFYRTNKFLWRDHEHYEQTPEDISRGCCANMITKEEMKAEIDFFQLNIELSSPPPVIEKPDPRAEMLNKFIGVMESFISTAKGLYVHKINITFPCYDKDSFFIEPKIKMLVDIIYPFFDSGYRLLEKYGKDIGIYLEENDNELKWECNTCGKGWVEAKCIVKIEIKEGVISSIIANSVLGGIRGISQ
ncbi:BTB/POZ protein [Glomus cerebriforme]|uniref:BTB/POZ protein n=1 Tax=Glomus cerebriforme TaxID=658196 RepID=A0A397SL47_9GLOM|nr:BTB/POZ protein [Glomus cerebriforme]